MGEGWLRAGGDVSYQSTMILLTVQVRHIVQAAQPTERRTQCLPPKTTMLHHHPGVCWALRTMEPLNHKVFVSFTRDSLLRTALWASAA